MRLLTFQLSGGPAFDSQKGIPALLEAAQGLLTKIPNKSAVSSLGRTPSRAWNRICAGGGHRVGRNPAGAAQCVCIHGVRRCICIRATRVRGRRGWGSAGVGAAFSTTFAAGLTEAGQAAGQA